MFDVVVAADLAWGIGKANALPWPKLRGDLAHFKRLTTEAPEGRQNAIVMGRKTWQSHEVGGRALPRRLNVVVTRGELAVPEGVVVAGSLDDALGRTDRIAADVFVIGGAQIYREAVAHSALRFVYLTRVAASFDCDTTIPDLDALGFTRVPWDGEQACQEHGVDFRIERLAKRARS